MATALKTRIEVDLSATFTSALDLQTLSAPAALRAAYSWSNGTGANQADLIWTDERTIAASSNEDLDLAGVLSSAFGATLTFATLKGLVIKAATGNTNNVVIARPASNGVPLFAASSDALAIKPGGMFVWVAPGTGVAVTAGTGDLLNVSNSSSGSSVTYQIAIIGTSA